MLEMEEQRLDFTDQLAPEEGYELVACVGTTYSLDMSALLGACLSLAGGAFRSEYLRNNPVGAFAAITKLRGKVAVFCEKGRIKNEDHTGKLGILLEPLINQVVVRRPRSAVASISSFHPKVWVLDFVNERDGSHKYRLIVASRNLTFSGSWDVAARLDGYDTESLVPESKGIADFLDYLRTSRGVEGDRATHALLKRLAGAIRRVRFDVDSSYFDSYEFLPFGPNGSGLVDAGKSALFTERLTKAVVISPFLGNDGPLKRLAENRVGEGSSADFHLLSRTEELRKLSPGLLAQYTCYAPKDWLADVSLEDEESGSPNAADYSDLHAKVYLTERYADRNLYLGSLNASRNGVQGNVEALLRLGLHKRRITSESLIDALVGDKKPFSIYEPEVCQVPPAEDAEKEARRIQLDRCFHAAAKLFTFRSVDITNRDHHYLLTVSYDLPLFDGFDEGLSLSISPYLAPGNALSISSPNGTAFCEGLTDIQVSELFILRGESTADEWQSSCVLRCPDSAFNYETDRDKRVQGVLDSILSVEADALPAYIALAFGMDIKVGQADGTKASPATSSRTETKIPGGIYEALLRSMAGAPDAKEQLEYAKLMLSFLPKRYDGQLLAMNNMVDQFEKAVKRHG